MKLLAGDARFEISALGAQTTVFIYCPVRSVAPGVLLLFHGKGRRAEQMRDWARSLADQAGLIVVAPLLDRDRFPNWRYQRAGIVHNDQLQPPALWTGSLIKTIVDWAREWLGDTQAPYYLYGHSAGGQFLSRTAAYMPQTDAKRIVLANPSLYVTPSLDEKAPYGFAGLFDRRTAKSRLQDYLRLPITIYVGERDVGDKDLVQDAPAARQGVNRLERGVNVFRSAQAVARERDWQFNWRLVIVPDVGHSSKDMLQAAAILQALDLDVC
ncbi:MAG: hypothetical protein ACR2O4_02115 [Hyphomicrobiaceae bacterium]